MKHLQGIQNRNDEFVPARREPGSEPTNPARHQNALSLWLALAVAPRISNIDVEVPNWN
jgi:hypothetical protein